jgi:rare lipoprotein A
MPQIPPDGRLLSTEEGLASWYGTVYDRRRGADGTVYDQNAMTAASRTLPLGVLARVTNLADGQVAVVKITDRGPFVPGRILDLSRAAAKAVGLDRAGVGKVRVEAYAGEGFQAAPARWCVQIGAFADPDDARQMKNDLLQRYRNAKVIAFDGPTGSWVRLTLATPEDRSRSAEVAAGVRVPDPGVEAYVTRIN